MEKRKLTPTESISVLSDGDYIHTFRNPGPGVMIGADIKRERIIDLIHEHSDTLQVGGDMCRKLKHGLVLFDSSGPLFIASDEARLNEIDPPK